MYKTQFGLQERPFSIAPDPRFLYLSIHYRDALAHLLYGISERGGFIQLTGAVGTGKTTLTRALLEQLPDSVDIALVLNSSVTAQELLLAVCEELRIELPTSAQSIPALMNVLRDYLLAAFARGRHTVVLIDEAQNLSPEALEQVRLLTNLETNREKLLQIILVGQPELRNLLALPGLHQVAQRVTARYHLTPLRWRETRQYIQHRLQVAGVEEPLFSRAAMRVIHKRAGGIPRLINIIADRALLGAYARGRQRVSARIARRAAIEVQGQAQQQLSFVFLGAAACLLGIAALAWSPARHQLPDLPTLPVLPELPLAAKDNAPLLDQLVQEHDPRLQPQIAIEYLFKLWQAQFATQSTATACQQAQQQDLACRVDNIDLETLLKRNLPTVLELQEINGARHGVLLLGVGPEHASIALADLVVEVPLAQLADSWSGNSMTLWRPPAVVKGSLFPGQRDAAVIWLRGQLKQIDGQSPKALDSQKYDAALQQRVETFQHQQGLVVDGIVGSDTLFHLVQAAPPAGTPFLQRN